MKKFALSLMMIFSLILSACAFDGKDDTDQRDLEDREELLRTFSQIQGIYTGTIETQYKTMPAKLTITYREVVVGKDSDGQPRYRPVLVARLSRPELFALDIRMDGKYISRTGDLTLSTTEGGGEFLQGRGSILGGNYQATLSNANLGFYGILRVSLLTREIRTEENDDAEQRDRIRNRMNLLAGTFAAVIKPDVTIPDETEDVIRSELRLLVEETDTFPRLVAYYNHKCGALLPIRSTVTFRPEMVPPEISFATDSGTSGLKISFAGTFVNSAIEGRFQFPTFSGTLKAAKRTDGLPTCKKPKN
jgi:hypothetical protein